MSYDFRLCLPQADRSREEIATADMEDLDITDPVPEKEARKQRISASLIARNPALEPFAFGFDEIAKPFEASLACYDGVSRDVAEQFPLPQKKPWWQFWK